MSVLNRFRPRLVCVLAAVVSAGAVGPASAQSPKGKAKAVPGADWPGFRGADRSGVSADRGLARAWPKDGPKLLWKAEGLGEGYGSVALAGGKVYVQGHRDGNDMLTCLDAADGRQLWSVRVAEAASADYPGARSTPTIDGDRIYCYGTAAELVCFSLAGAEPKELWRVKLKEAFGARCGPWGFSESPLVDGNRVVCTPGGASAELAALDKLTGKTLWKTDIPGDGNSAEYSSAVTAEAGNRRMIVQFLKKEVVGVSADDGRFLWSYEKAANGTANCSSPVVVPGGIVAASGYGTGGANVQLARAGNAVNAREAWFSRDLVNHHGGMVVVGRHLYATNERSLLCVDVFTGRTVWQDRSVGKGSIIAADGLLIVRSENGEVALVEANPAGYREKGRFLAPRTGGAHSWAHPALAGGRLFLRDWGTLYCHAVK
jgi:outer membrane protein assembly factor BamB